MGRRKEDAKENFEAKFVEDENSGCWNWMAFKDRAGYGAFGFDGRIEKSHRVAYQLYVGEIPEGLCVCHYCNNPSCVNPSHLFLRSHLERNKRDIKERFEEKFEEDEKSGCWNWTACKISSGYGRLKINGQLQLAHRVSWMLYIGEITDNLKVLHRCDNPSCVNPYHLFLGTIADNARDCVNKGRGVNNSGEKNSHAILTEKQVKTIRTMWANGARPIDLAREFGVSRATIYDIVTYRSWAKI